MKALSLLQVLTRVRAGQVFIGAAIGIFAAQPLHAQGDNGSVRGAVRASVGATLLKDEASGFWGVGGRLLIGRYGVGGSGYVTGGATFLGEGQANLRVDLGYGGLELDAPLPWIDTDRARLELLLGGGNAEVLDVGVGRELGADNFLVLEPRVSWSRPMAAFLEGAVVVGYRTTLGVDDLPGIGTLSLSGPSLSLSLTLLRQAGND